MTLPRASSQVGAVDAVVREMGELRELNTLAMEDGDDGAWGWSGVMLMTGMFLLVHEKDGLHLDLRAFSSIMMQVCCRSALSVLASWRIARPS
jgi:hypothetical protein